ncbi:MAG: hypothetical protein PHU85_06640, partial [Phycisphaerae bacterium]|nr:hypothetical protein [Phycisphaerae bacterium]
MTMPTTGRWGLMILVALVAAAPALAFAQPASAPDVAKSPTSQPVATSQPTPPEAAELLAVIQQVGPRGEMTDQRAMMEYTARLKGAQEALAKLQKDFPEVAGRDDVRATELDMLFDASYLQNDPQMKLLRAAIAKVLADDRAGRGLRAMAEYHQLNADAISRAATEPASQPDTAPPWVGAEMDRRIAFGRKYSDQEVGRQAFAGAIIYKARIDGYAKVAPLVGDFMKTFADRDLQAMLLAQLTLAEFSRPRDGGWAVAKPIADRLIKEFHGEAVTPQVLSAIAVQRMRSDVKGSEEMAGQLTNEFPGNEAVARVWRELTLQAAQTKKPQLVADRLKVLADKFPKSEARVETLATLAHIAFRQDGLEAVLPQVKELAEQFPKSPVVVRLQIVLAGEQLEKVGYDKAA